MYPPHVPHQADSPITPPLRKFAPKARNLVGSLALAALCFAGTVTAVAFLDMAGRPAGLDAGSVEPLALSLVAMIVAFLAPWSVFLRNIAPVSVVLATSALPLVLPYDAITPLVCLPAVFARRSGAAVVGCTVAAAAAVAAATWRQLALVEEYRLFTVRDEITGRVDTVLPAAVYVVLGLLALGVSVGIGLWRRAVAGRRDVTTLTEQHTAETAVLHDRITRQTERDEIAREVHDTVAHSLSQIALQASVLETSADTSTEIRDAAARIRASARQAGTELRGVLTTLRTGAEGLTPVSFDDLGALLLSLHDQGARINSTVLVSEGHTAAAVLTRACYRIVQESVTNALKHAPGLPIDIVLRGAPLAGVTITVRNPLPDGATDPATGTHSGITGMTERALALGGGLTAGPTDARWVVDAHLPWHPA
jgi:signal transduction histidine kinase